MLPSIQTHTSLVFSQTPQWLTSSVHYLQLAYFFPLQSLVNLYTMTPCGNKRHCSPSPSDISQSQQGKMDINLYCYIDHIITSLYTILYKYSHWKFSCTTTITDSNKCSQIANSYQSIRPGHIKIHTICTLSIAWAGLLAQCLQNSHSSNCGIGVHKPLWLLFLTDCDLCCGLGHQWLRIYIADCNIFLQGTIHVPLNMMLGNVL